MSRTRSLSDRFRWPHFFSSRRSWWLKEKEGGTVQKRGDDGGQWQNMSARFGAVWTADISFGSQSGEKRVLLYGYLG